MESALRELRSDVTINAPAERVWELLTDFGSFSDWNPFMLRASGELAIGRKLVVYLKPPGGMGMTFRPRVVKVDPNREFRWLGHLVIPRIFDGEHIFEIEPIMFNKGGNKRLTFLGVTSERKR